MKKKSNIWIYLSIQIAISFMLSSSCNKETEPDPVNVTDIEGNVYNVVRIGKQLWIKGNLKTTKFNDGTIIPIVTDSSIWKSIFTPACCWYDNDSSTNKNTYGALYNWFSVNTGILCPTDVQVAFLFHPSGLSFR